MQQFGKYELPWWAVEDLEDLSDEYPGLVDMSKEELEKLKGKLYWEAQGYIDIANRIEAKADVIDLLIKAMD